MAVSLEDQAIVRRPEASDGRSKFVDKRPTPTCACRLHTPRIRGAGGAILGFAEMIFEDAEQRGRDPVLNDLRRLHQAGCRLKELVSGVLDPARLRQDFPDFRRNLRHDLRSSISVINGLGEMLLEDAQNARDEALASDLDKLLQSGTRLLEQVDMLIDFTATAVSLVPGEPESPAVSTMLNSVRPLSHAAPVGPGPGRILIVDDTRRHGSSCRGVWSVKVTRSWRRKTAGQHLTEIAAEPFDLVLLDMMMPDINGYEVLTQLKADVGFRHIPVIILSAFDEIDSAVRCIEAGRKIFSPNPSIRLCCERASAHPRGKVPAPEPRRARSPELEPEERWKSSFKHPPQIDHTEDASWRNTDCRAL